MPLLDFGRSCLGPWRLPHRVKRRASDLHDLTLDGVPHGFLGKRKNQHSVSHG